MGGLLTLRVYESKVFNIQEGLLTPIKRRKIMKKTMQPSRILYTAGVIAIVILSLGIGCSGKDEYVPSPPPVYEHKDCSYVMEMNGTVPVHQGETVYVEGIATMGTAVMVSGRYFKIHIQDSTGGIYVFADTQATVEDQGYDGSTFSNVNVYIGDRVGITGTIGSFGGMVEFYPLSGTYVDVLERGVAVPAPMIFNSVDDIYESGYEYVGDLVRINGVELQGDPAALWPGYKQTAKELELMTEGDTNTLTINIYPGSGIPGSTPPSGPFDLVGCLHREEDKGGNVTYTLYPRALFDLNPLSGSPISGPELSVYKASSPEDAVMVPVSGLPQCMYDTGRTKSGGTPVGPEPVVILESFIVPQAASDPREWEYKIVARDGRQPARSLEYDEMKSGVLYENGEGVDSYFYEGMDLDHIFFLVDVAEIVLYPKGGGGAPQPGPATHGEGVNLIINETNYPVNFEDLPDPGSDNKLPLTEFVPDSIISIYTMDGFFAPDQIRMLYDYHLVSHGGGQECTVTWEELQTGEVDMSGLPAVAGIDGCPVTDLFTIYMIRKLVVDDGVEEHTFYWKDLPIRVIDIGGGETEQVVFFDDILDTMGMTEADKPLYDYYLWASDNFGTYFPYGHSHLVDMYFNPLTNSGYVTDDNPEMVAYGGRYSTKSILKMEFRPVPQALPSLYVDGLGWLSDPASSSACNGCHVKKGVVEKPVNCALCH